MRGDIPSPAELRILILLASQGPCTADRLSRLWRSKLERAAATGSLWTPLRRLRAAGLVDLEHSIERVYVLTDDGNAAIVRGRRYYRGLPNFTP